jgi:5-methylcytosine-specific restriction endonuclease McrA
MKRRRKFNFNNHRHFIVRAMLREDNKCYICQKRLTFDTATIDHFIPLSRGGDDTPENRKLACEGCNLEKGDKVPAEAECDG